MEVVSLTPELKAQLDEYAQRHGQEPEAALVDILTAALEWDRHEHDETVQCALEAHEDVKAGRILTPGLVQMAAVLQLNRMELKEMINQER
jgi:plasmid stability protein